MRILSKKLFFNNFLLKNKKHLFILKFFIILFFIFYFCFPLNVFAGLFDDNPALVSKLIEAFEKIKMWLIGLSTPAAAVAVGVGVFMKKFSFGDEERIRTAKKLIRGTLFSYAFILAIDLILSAISSLIS